VTVVIAPPMLAAQENAWRGLLEIFARLPAGWCLVGGQLVHLHCWERGYAPNRPTNDADAALDVRARPEILLEFTRVLTEIGFATAGSNMRPPPTASPPTNSATDTSPTWQCWPR
jgi:hypothetical protein